MNESTVYVIDDDPSVRRALDRLLRSHHRQVSTYSSAQDFLSKKLDPGPACIVLDLKMPEMSGLDLQQLLAPGRDHLPIVFISGHGDISVSVRAMKAGAVDFLTKPFEASQVLGAIDTALERSRQACLSRETFERDRMIFESLSHRERQVCLRVAQGMLNKQIGGELGITEKTIKVHRGRVMQKLGAHCAADLVRLVERLRATGYFSNH
jgi:FixJ family two-component response regulator